MSTERINQLHEQASERYLNGDYAGAIEAWQDVLGIDPNNEEAQGGVRMASQFVNPQGEQRAGAAPPSAAGGVEQELEPGLKVLDGMDVTTMLDPEHVDGVTDLPAHGSLDGWDMTPSDASGDEPVGLAPVRQSSLASPMPVSAAGAELKRRVDDLLNQAKMKAETGERDEALAVLARLSILDEDNLEAAELRSKLETAGASDLDKVERAIIEGVAALEADQIDEAERYFLEALAVAPDHREAKHYLEKVAARRASGEEDLLHTAIGEAPPAEDAVTQAVPLEPRPQEPRPAPRASRAEGRPAAEVSDPPPAASSRRISLPSPKVLLIGAAGLAVVVLAIIAVPKPFGGGAKPAPQAAAPPSVRRPKPPAAAARPDGGAAAPITAGATDGIATVADGLKEGRARMAAGDFGGAVLAFNQALSLDPANADARAGFNEARDRYNASKEEREALDTIKLAFRDGEFTAGLRLAYRLPPTVSKTYGDAIKVVGWYNLAVVALRAGDCKGALTQIDEALEVNPADADAKALKDLATRYADAVKDRVFFDRVEALAFRPIPAS